MTDEKNNYRALERLAEALMQDWAESLYIIASGAKASCIKRDEFAEQIAAYATDAWDRAPAPTADDIKRGDKVEREYKAYKASKKMAENAARVAKLGKKEELN